MLCKRKKSNSKTCWIFLKVFSYVDCFCLTSLQLDTFYHSPMMSVQVVKILASKGVNMVPFNLNYAVPSAQSIINFTVDVGMLSHFDHWQRSGEDDYYEAQDQWPVEIRRARLIPAVDYVQVRICSANH